MSTTYFLALWGRTLLALLALGVAGGGLLSVLRAAKRPWLWLASPLAGLIALALALPALHHRAGLTVPQALVVALLGLGAFTALRLWRDRPAVCPKRLALGVAVLLAASAWATYGCNTASIRSRGPAIAPADGTDTFGYAAYADWLLSHPGEAPPDYDRALPHLAYVRAMWDIDSRYGAYVLLAAASWVRGLPALFAYDWLIGVILAAAVAGMAGLFARRRAALVLLALAAALSAWFALTRTGYLGKSLAYPGTVLLCWAAWACWQRFSWPRLAALAAVGAGVALCLHPVLPLVISALVLASGLAAGVLCRRPLCTEQAVTGGTWKDWLLFAAVTSLVPAGVWLTLGPGAVRPALGGGLLLLIAAFAAWRQWAGGGTACFFGLTWKCLAAGVCCFVAAALPPLLARRLTHPADYAYHSPQLPTDWLLAQALDLESFGLRLLSVEVVGRLLAAGLVLAGAFVLLAWLLRKPAACAPTLAGCGVLATAAVAPGQLYVFHGLLFPLTACGAALTWQQMRRQPAWRRLAVLGLLAALVALRLPQHHFSWLRYASVKEVTPRCQTLAAVEALARQVGPSSADLVTTDLYSAQFALATLPRQGCRLQLREPTWTMLLAGWAPGRVADRNRAAAPDWLAPPDYPKGGFTLSDWPGVLSMPGAARASRMCLTEDAAGVGFLGCDARPGAAGSDVYGSYLWLGRDPARLRLWNGRGAPLRVTLVSQGGVAHETPDPGTRTVSWALAGQTGSVETAPARGWATEFGVTLAPGLNDLQLFAGPPAGAALNDSQRALHLRNARLIVSPTDPVAPATTAGHSPMEGTE